MVQHDAEVVVAARGMVPGQPVNQHRRRCPQRRRRLREHLLVAAEHALGVDDRLGLPGGAGGQEEFRDRIRADGRVRLLHRGGGWRCFQFGKPVSRHDFGARGNRRRDCFREAPAVSSEHEPRRKQPDDIPQLGEVGRNERVGRRHRHIGDAHVHARQREQRMLDVVV